MSKTLERKISELEQRRRSSGQQQDGVVGAIDGKPVNAEEMNEYLIKISREMATH